MKIKNKIKPNNADIQRFWEKVDKTPGHGPQGKCWIWTGSKLPKGYGLFGINGVVLIAHRVTWAISHGKSPYKLVLHRCDYPSCVRPEHLRLGTHSTNNKEAWSKGRQVLRAGEKHHNVRLTEPMVREMRLIRATTGQSFAAIARIFDTNRATTREAIIGITWKHVK